MSKLTFRTARSGSKYTGKYCINYGGENGDSDRKTIFLFSLREVRAKVAELKERGYSEETTPLSLTL